MSATTVTALGFATAFGSMAAAEVGMVAMAEVPTSNRVAGATVVAIKVVTAVITIDHFTGTFLLPLGNSAGPKSGHSATLFGAPFASEGNFIP